MAGPGGIRGLTAPAVRRAIAECDKLGRDQFLSQYGYGRARSYFLRVNGREYDSKAIAGVAFGYLPGAHGALRASDFTGGEQTVWAVLTNLGFTVDGVAPSASEARPTADPDELERRARAIDRDAGKAPLARPPGNKKPPRVSARRMEFERDPAVVAFVRRRAAGKCELCRQVAPFKRADDSPFLEVHHVETLAEGGEDTVENAAALCPNCHRELHYGRERVARVDQLRRNVPALGRPG